MTHCGSVTSVRQRSIVDRPAALRTLAALAAAAVVLSSMLMAVAEVGLGVAAWSNEQAAARVEHGTIRLATNKGSAALLVREFDPAHYSAAAFADWEEEQR